MTTASLPARRLSLLTGLRNSLTLTWRSVLKIRTNSEDLLGLSLQPIMFLLLFTYVFGGAIEHGSVQQYLEYVLPGILVQTVLFATLGTGLMLNQDISAGIFDRFRSLPIARWAPLAGAIMGDVTRYVISVVVTLGERQDEAQDHEHAHQQRDLRAQKARTAQPEGPAQEGGRHGQDPERHQRAHAQPAHGRALVLARRARGRIVAGVVAG